MELILILLVILIAGGIIWRMNKQDSINNAEPPTLTTVVDVPKEAPEPTVEIKTTSILDQNNDGVVNTKDVKAAVKKVRRKVKEVADVNKDGAVNAKDVAAVVEKVKPKPKKTSKKA